MYFSNIGNAELQHFHKTAGANLSMSLTKILSSDLFHKECLGNNIYRIYPLFYCNEIISSNDDDKIIDNSCLIVTRQDRETYLSFMTNDEKSNVLIDEDILDIKRIGESLDTDEFNAFVYRLRKLGVISAHLDFEEINNIVGDYGRYIFNNIKGQLKNDVGIIVNNEIKNNPITVKLENPFFLDAKYILTFTVTSLTGANICEVESEDFKTVETFDIELVEDNEVSIDLTDYINDSVLLFDFVVSISFDTPEIVNGDFDLTITSDKERISLGEAILLTATLTSDDNVSGYTVEFFEDGELIGSDSTDNNGVASLNYTPQISSNHNYSCNVLGINNSINVSVFNKNTKLLLNSSDENIRVDNEITLTGQLLDYDDNPLGNMRVKLYENNNLIDNDITTDSNGEFTKIITHNVCGNYSYRVEYSGTNGYLSATSNLANVVIYKYPTNISLTTNASTVYVKKSGDMSSQFTVSGTLTKEGAGFSTSVKLYNNNSKIADLTTNTNGEFSKILYPNGNPQVYNLQAKYEGTDKIQNADSNNVTVTARKTRTYLTCNVNKNEVYPGENVTVSGKLTDEFGNGIANCIIDLNEMSATTNSNGDYSASYQYASQNIGTKNIIAKFNGYRSTSSDWFIGDRYEKNQSSSVSVRCVKFPVAIDILNTKASYDSGDNLLIEVTSPDTNLNLNSISINFNGISSNVTTKDNNGRFIFTVPNIDRISGNFNISTSISEDSTHEGASDTKTITVYGPIQTLTISKSGKNLIVNAKNRNNVNASNITIPILEYIFTGFAFEKIVSENAVLDNNGNVTLPLTSLIGSGTVYASYNELNSNTLNVTF